VPGKSRPTGGAAAGRLTLSILSEWIPFFSKQKPSTNHDDNFIESAGDDRRIRRHSPRAGQNIRSHIGVFRCPAVSGHPNLAVRVSSTLLSARDTISTRS
jgi:hypothetical protein